MYHVEDGLQDEVYVDHGRAGPVLHGPDPRVVAPQQGPGQLVQGGPLVLLGYTGHFSRRVTRPGLSEALFIH